MKIMYAIAFDMDTKKMSELFGETNYRNKYKEVENFFEEHHFHWTQGSLYYGDSDRAKVNMPSTFKMLDNLNKTFPWFKDCVKDIRILTIGEDDNLMSYLKDA
jgi:virulence-associated protein VapD